jgi:putative nucleotidyltransferase with HDIG domain
MRYRVWQFRQAITLHRLDQEDYAIVRAMLPPDGQRLFASMSESDQHHSLLLYRALRSRGCADKEMLAAALLHDIGKGAGRVQLWVRPLVVLARAFNHAAIGADLAAAAGLPERTVLLIRAHHQLDGPAALLRALDEKL